jgi:hypothetical protein
MRFASALLVGRSFLLVLAAAGMREEPSAVLLSGEGGRFRLEAASPGQAQSGSALAVRFQLEAVPAGAGVAAVTVEVTWDPALLAWDGHRQGPEGAGGWVFVVVNDQDAPAGRVLVSAFSPENVPVASVVRELVFVPSAPGVIEVRGRILAVGDESGTDQSERFTLEPLRIEVRGGGVRKTEVQKFQVPSPERSGGWNGM